MIDVNPEELVGDKSILIRSFFSYIFPETSLKKSREELGYSVSDNMTQRVLNKMYISLEENLKMFLPNTLTEEELDLFVSHYKKLLLDTPKIQSKLDAEEYPINMDKVKKVLTNM
ncbi:MAG: hypothetical protein GXP45_06260 [bacterium]|nr:hypothetical protein [bacterium]